MRRILVPLDGTQLAASILPDAVKMAGKSGVLVLIRDTVGTASDRRFRHPHHEGKVAAAVLELEEEADRLRANGVSVEVHGLMMIDAAWAIDQAALLYKADMIACATHARSLFGRLLHGGVAWRALANSSVPVLMRSPSVAKSTESLFRVPPRILVPLDRSPYAEQALPLAQELAKEWNASLWLVHVLVENAIAYTPGAAIPVYSSESQQEAHEYLDNIARNLQGEVHAHVLVGGTVDEIVTSTKAWSVDCVVMTTHGRTGLARAVLGSVADELVQRSPCPLLLIPPLAVKRQEMADNMRIRELVTS